MKTILFLSLTLFALTSAHAQDCNTCSGRVQTALDKNATYQKLINEGSQSGIYRATKMMYQQMLISCPDCVDKETTQEMITQLDGMINALKSDPNGLTFDTSDEATKPRLNPSPKASPTTRPVNTVPAYQPRPAGRTMTSGIAN